MFRALALLIGLMLCSSAQARDVRITTWNVGWLTERAGELEQSPGRRPIYQRTADDFARLARYVDVVNPDIIALQEVDGAGAASRILDPQQYRIFLTDEDDMQRPALAVRRGRGIDIQQNPDVVGLDLLDGQPRSLRRGLDATITIGKSSLRVLVVHLKSGCFSPAQKGEACDLINRQAPIIQAWIDARQAEGQAFAVLGDFNRRLGNQADPLRQLLDDGPRPVSILNDAPSKCWGGRYPDPIDHIILGEGADKRVMGRAQELVYQETDPADRDRLSDHCPVSVMLDY
jgi:endonuclease/exonuclease/phosphatase family metal-dependent hydrolase